MNSKFPITTQEECQVTCHNSRGRQISLLQLKKWPNSRMKLHRIPKGSILQHNPTGGLYQNKRGSLIWQLNSRVRAVFLGHTSTAHEETGCGSVSESAGCNAVVTSSRWYSTANGPKVRNCEPATCFRNPKGCSKASSSRSKKTAIGWIFKQLQGRAVLRHPDRKMRILPPWSGIQVHTKVCPRRIQECSRQT